MTFGEDTIIEFKKVSFSRGARLIFEEVDIKVPRGKVTAIMGPSGAGKTTLLKLIGGQIVPDTGEVWVQGKEVPSLSRAQLYDLRRGMGMLFQSGALFTDISVFDNVAYPLREHTKLSEDMIRDLVLMKLQAVGLRGACHLMPAELSGGMGRRVALARAIAMDPAIILYDEPFAGQDPILMGVLVQLIRLLNDALGMTSVIVSHDLHETLSIADYIYIIADGRIAGSGTPDSLINNNTEWVQQFMQGLPDGPLPFHYPAQEFSNELWGQVQ